MGHCPVPVNKNSHVYPQDNAHYSDRLLPLTFKHVHPGWYIRLLDRGTGRAFQDIRRDKTYDQARKSEKNNVSRCTGKRRTNITPDEHRFVVREIYPGITEPCAARGEDHPVCLRTPVRTDASRWSSQGSTRPVVPRTEIPPVIPRRGFKVFPAILSLQVTKSGSTIPGIPVIAKPFFHGPENLVIAGLLIAGSPAL